MRISFAALGRPQNAPEKRIASADIYFLWGIRIFGQVLIGEHAGLANRPRHSTPTVRCGGRNVGNEQEKAPAHRSVGEGSTKEGMGGHHAETDCRDADVVYRLREDAILLYHFLLRYGCPSV